MSKRAIELSEFERRESRHEMSQLTLEHQGEEIASDGEAEEVDQHVYA